MVISAIASTNLPAGYAAYVSAGKGYPAGPGLATGIVMLGAPTGSIVTLESSGVLYLPDWTLATGSKYLSIGSTYWVTSSGLIRPDVGTGQAIGYAISIDELNVSISPTIVTTTTPQQVIAGSGPPAPRLGNIGDIYIDWSNYGFYGPKVVTGWGFKHPFTS